MMTYSNRDICQAIKTGRILIDPLDEADVQPASVDLHLGPMFKIIKPNATHPVIYKDIEVIDPKRRVEYEEFGPCDEFVLQPHDFVLAPTIERIALSTGTVGRVEGKSSLGRMGLIIHSTAGFIDPGFEGQITLELANLTQWPIVLYPGMAVCQIAFHMLMTPATTPYGHERLRSKYQGQEGPTGSRIHENFVVRSEAL